MLINTAYGTNCSCREHMTDHNALLRGQRQGGNCECSGYDFSKDLCELAFSTGSGTNLMICKI